MSPSALPALTNLSTTHGSASEVYDHNTVQVWCNEVVAKVCISVTADTDFGTYTLGLVHLLMDRAASDPALVEATIHAILEIFKETVVSHHRKESTPRPLDSSTDAVTGAAVMFERPVSGVHPCSIGAPGDAPGDASTAAGRAALARRAATSPARVRGPDPRGTRSQEITDMLDFIENDVDLTRKLVSIVDKGYAERARATNGTRQSLKRLLKARLYDRVALFVQHCINQAVYAVVCRAIALACIYVAFHASQYEFMATITNRILESVFGAVLGQALFSTLTMSNRLANAAAEPVKSLGQIVIDRQRGLAQFVANSFNYFNYFHTH